MPTSGSVRVPLLTSFNIKGRLVRIESSALVARSGSLSPCDSESLETGREGIISGTVQREKAARKRGSTGNPNSAQTVGESPVIRQKLHEVQYCTCIACASSLIIFDTGCLCASCLNACVRVPDALSPRSIGRGAARCSSYAECESLLSPRTARVGPLMVCMCYVLRATRTQRLYNMCIYDSAIRPRQRVTRIAPCSLRGHSSLGAVREDWSEGVRG